MSNNTQDISSYQEQHKVVSIENEMKKSYMEYSMSVIVSRALPDVRDGLKPVHRRILFAMYDTGNTHDKPFRKSARVIGEVIGKYHPHGNDPIYYALVRLAQDFSLRVPLIKGQGNFGSIDGDLPAAMRYTEAKLDKISHYMLCDIDQDTVLFVDNYDGSEKEPTVLPARFPNLLVNGTSGIAVGMATNIPPHNLGEVLDACCAYIDNPEITPQEIIEIVPAPDFPTGGIIVGSIRAKHALLTGKGSIITRAVVEIEQIGNSNAIIIKEIPYQVNKAELVRKIEELSRNKIVEGISELRDETNKLGVRVVVELKRDAIPEVIINQLYKHTDLQTSFGMNMLALNNGMPMMMGVHDVIVAFVKFREEVIRNRTAYELNKARNRAHILIGLYLAVCNIDEVIAIIKSSDTPAIARQKLIDMDWQAAMIEPLLKLVDDYRNVLRDGRCKFTEEQAEAILEMKLARLTGLEKEKIESELKNLATLIAELLDLLNSREKLFAVMRNEFVEIKNMFASPRRTQIIDEDFDFNAEDLIQREDMVITTTMTGFIKRVPLATYRAQKRGGKGRSAMSTYDDDITTDIIVASTHAPMLFFSSFGKVYRMKVYKLPMSSPQSKGKALVNLLPLAHGETITNIVALPEDDSLWADKSIIFATKKGQIRRNDLDIFSNIQSNGKIAIKLDDDDSLIGVAICNPESHVLLVTRYGKAIRFPVAALRVFKSRSSDGVRGMMLGSKDSVVSMSVVCEVRMDIEKREEYLKISDAIKAKYRKDNDIAALEDAIKKDGHSLEKLTIDEAANLASKEQHILSITENGYGKRTSVYEYRVTARGGQGVMNMDTSERNGAVVASMPVTDNDQVMILTDGGTLIRTAVKDIRITGRNAMGVKILDTKQGEKLKSITRIIEESSEIANDDTEEETNSTN